MFDRGFAEPSVRVEGVGLVPPFFVTVERDVGDEERRVAVDFAAGDRFACQIEETIGQNLTLDKKESKKPASRYQTEGSGYGRM